MVVKQRNGEATFVFDEAAEAKKVYLVGDFNNWNPAARRMAKRKDGTFRARTKLPEGQHQYKFVVDGEWRHDSSGEETVRNEYGSYNSVANV